MARCLPRLPSREEMGLMEVKSDGGKEKRKRHREKDEEDERKKRSKKDEADLMMEADGDGADRDWGEERGKRHMSHEGKEIRRLRREEENKRKKKERKDEKRHRLSHRKDKGDGVSGQDSRCNSPGRWENKYDYDLHRWKNLNEKAEHRSEDGKLLMDLERWVPKRNYYEEGIPLVYTESGLDTENPRGEDLGEGNANLSKRNKGDEKQTCDSSEKTHHLSTGKPRPRVGIARNKESDRSMGKQKASHDEVADFGAHCSMNSTKVDKKIKKSAWLMEETAKENLSPVTVSDVEFSPHYDSRLNRKLKVAQDYDLKPEGPDEEKLPPQEGSNSRSVGVQLSERRRLSSFNFSSSIHSSNYHGDSFKHRLYRK